MKNIIYGFYWNFCIHESSPSLISLHYKEEDAIKAMEEFKAEQLKKFIEEEKYSEEFAFEQGWVFQLSKFMMFEACFVKELEIK
jgi:hypothetical protein